MVTSTFKGTSEIANVAVLPFTHKLTQVPACEDDKSQWLEVEKGLSYWYSAWRDLNAALHDETRKALSSWWCWETTVLTAIGQLSHLAI